MEIKNKIKVKNFGSIKKADVDIAPLTIFTGHNNSGKSYLAMLIQSFLNPIGKMDSKLKRKIKLNPLNCLSYYHNETLNEYEDKLNEYLNSKKDFSKTPFTIPLNLIQKLIYDGTGIYYFHLIGTKLQNTFVKDFKQLKNIKTNKDFSVQFNDIEIKYENNKVILNDFPIDLNEKSGGLILNIAQDKDCVSMTLNTEVLNDEDYYERLYPLYVYVDLSLMILGDLIPNFSSRMKISEFDKNSVDNELYKDIAVEMSENILGSTYTFNKEFDLEDIKNNCKFPYEALSSSAKQLTLLIKYLIEDSLKNDTIIIEEPETHLDRESQRKLAKYLAILINNDLNIVLTTHSDYMVEELNKNLSREKIKIYNFKKESEYLYRCEEVEIN